MSRDFSKNVSNYLSLGSSALGALINGAAVVSVFARVFPDSYTGGTQNDNLALSIIVNTNLSGVTLGVDDSGGTKTLRVTGRSVSGDSRQARNGTTGITTGSWWRLGGVLNFAGDTITPYVNGAAEGGGGVTFGNNAYTLGTPSIPDTVGGYDAPPATVAQFDGRIAELAVWVSDIGAAGFLQLERASPRLVSPATLVCHLELTGRGSPEVDAVGGVSGTVTGSLPAADDPVILRPCAPLAPMYVRPAVVQGYSVAIEMEFDGRGNGWTDLTPDLSDDPIRLRYGIGGNRPQDRVANTGLLEFGLKNYDANHVLGYYSPGHPNRRANWALGNRVRLAITVNGTTFYKHVGKLDTIVPVPGLFNEQTVACQSADWMDDAAQTNVTGLAVQFAKRSDQLFSTLVASMPTQPDAIEIVLPGNETYEIAFDTAEDEDVAVLTELQKIAASELGLVYIKGDQVAGGTLVFEGRSKRGTSRTNVATFTETAGLMGLDVAQSRADIISKIQVINHPKVVDAAATTILYDLLAKVPVGANATITLLGPYRDPNQQASRVGGTSMQAPHVDGGTVDYAMNTLADGSGTNLTANFSVVANYGGTGVRYTITNTGSQSGYITKLQARGKGVYSYQTVVLEAGASVSTIGGKTESLDQSYQSNPSVGDEIARYLAALYRDATLQISRAEVFAHATDFDLLDTLMRREISDRIGLVESVSGVTDTGPGTVAIGYFINEIEIEIDNRNNTRVAFLVAPADKTAYWLLEVPGSSELDGSTVLGFGQIVGHVDVPAVFFHTDVAHQDTAHADTPHSDSLHEDAGHADAGHADAAHSDSPHVDTPHNDEAHEDVAHQDAAHVDNHGDDAHVDEPHGDHSDHVDHQDVGHADQSFHGDAHTDSAHVDTHGDTAHSDAAHTDEAHGDAGHVDTAHSDVAHVDTPHSDAGHADVLHGDTAHVDTAHQDVAHEDAHGDTAHGDA